MVIGPNFVYIAVPRTASHSIAKHWLLHYGGVDRDSEDHHKHKVPLWHHWKFTWTVVRNPYARVASLWLLMQKFTDILEKEMRGVTFEDFPEWLRCGPWPKDPWPYRWMAQVPFLSASRIDRVVHFENLEAELRELPFVQHWTDVPRINVSKAPRPEFTPAFIAGVNRYEKESFEAYGYKRMTA